MRLLNQQKLDRRALKKALRKYQRMTLNLKGSSVGEHVLRCVCRILTKQSPPPREVLVRLAEASRSTRSPPESSSPEQHSLTYNPSTENLHTRDTVNVNNTYPYTNNEDNISLDTEKTRPLIPITLPRIYLAPYTFATLDLSLNPIGIYYTHFAAFNSFTVFSVKGCGI